MRQFSLPLLNPRKAIVRLVSVGLIISSLLLVTLGHLPANAAVAKHYTELTFPPLPEIQIPPYTRFQLKNGMVVYLMEDHEFPLVSGTALIRTGDRLEPANKVGLAELTGTVIRTGGTQKHTADELNQLLEQRAASVETGIDTAVGSASFDTLTEDLEPVFDLFAEVVRQPAFAAEKLTLAKTQKSGEIARRNDDPSDIAEREFGQLIYGENSPYGRIVEYSTLANIERDDLVKFYQTYFHPNNIILGVVGDFDSQAMRSLIEAKFGDWQPTKTAQKAALPPVTPANQGGIFLVDQPQLTQSSVLVGHLGGQFNHPDYPALSVANEVLNGFGGRLFNQLRSREGLAYSVYAVWSPRYDYPGLFISGGQTRSDATVPFIQSLVREIENIRKAPVSEKELAQAKDSVLNSFVFNFQTPAQTLSRLARYEYYGYPADFLFRYQKKVEATTVADVQRVAQKHLQPDKLVKLVVGNAKAIQPPLTQLSSKTPVKQIDITIPQPQPIP